MEKKYWKGLEELKSDAEFVSTKNDEFAEPLPLEEIFSAKAGKNSTTDRRDFLKFLGFGVAAATLASCESPVTKTIPYLVKPEEITPGIANWYASSYADGNDFCSILIKTREGRPIKIEGNPSSPVTAGGVNARVQASVLSLYDSARLRGPLVAGKGDKWSSVDSKIRQRLTDVAAKGGKICIMSSTIMSPTTKKAIAEFSAKHPNTEHVTYDAVSYSGMLEANRMSFGKAVIPSYRFDKANVIVGVGADFVTNWLSPIEYSRQYGQSRKLRGQKGMSKHIQFESSLSVTGSNADRRIAVKPSEHALVILSLYNQLAALSGASTIKDKPLTFMKDVEMAAKQLWANKGKALVVCGSNDPHCQSVVNAINTMLDSYGNTIDMNAHSNMKQGDDKRVAELVSQMNAGTVGAIIFYGTNPVYTMPKPEEFKRALSKVGTKISFADRADETAALCDFVCPDSHYLESWNDYEPKKGHFTLAQPVISPLFSTRQAQASFLAWADNSTDYHTYLMDNWKSSLNSTGMSGDAFWVGALQAGMLDSGKPMAAPETSSGGEKKESKLRKLVNEVLGKDEEVKPSGAGTTAPRSGSDIAAASAAILAAPQPGAGLEIEVYEKTGLGNGMQANNPWLQEFPDPVSKITWDNYLAVSPKYAADNNLEQGSVVTVEANGYSVKVPVLIQPGQAYGSASIALGYGRTHAGKAANNVGANAYPLMKVDSAGMQRNTVGKITKDAGPLHEFAATQTHHTMMGRAIVKETTLTEYLKDPQAGNPPLLLPTSAGPQPVEEVTLWDEHEKPKHRWGMAIDLNSCLGCGACVVACQAENNVPVVGKDEVRRSREMHWIRIDRYYSSDMTRSKGETQELATTTMMSEMEVPSENPQVVFQPVMCQHCNHAPCETVCPVAATTHSSEGLNQMTYNRCIGTRYCANNCPYKVRRFNWFKYADNDQFDFNMNDDLGKMVLNPDVVVRSRGVMEKCSMCVQRIQEGKLNAKKEKRNVKDGEIKTACAQSCPTNAIVFGDYRNPESEIAQLEKDGRAYHLLAELNTQPNIVYLTKVRNTESSEA